MNESNPIDILIGKIISGNATSEEIQELEGWKNNSGEHLIQFEKSKKVWEKAEKYIAEQTLKHDKSKLEAEYARYLSAKIRKMNRQSFIYKVAAILAFPVALALGWYFFGNNFGGQESPQQFCEIISPKGHVSKAILPDGTEVWINSNSSIIYDANSFNNIKREIKLTGEAYFEVVSDKENPFTVITPHANVKVTGTSFNVNAYPASNVFETVLSEGNIELQFKTGNRENFDMNPGQRAIFHFDKNDLLIQQVDAKLFTSWRNGEIIFKDATLADLVKELERIYDIQFHMQPAKLGELRFRGMFSYNNNLIEALEKIKKSSNVDYYIENKEVWLKKSN